MRLPFSLPYRCGDARCPCVSANAPGYGTKVRVQTRPGRAHRATVWEDGMRVDEFEDEDIGALLEAVHREWPLASTTRREVD